MAIDQKLQRFLTETEPYSVYEQTQRYFDVSRWYARPCMYVTQQIAIVEPIVTPHDTLMTSAFAVDPCMVSSVNPTFEGAITFTRKAADFIRDELGVQFPGKDDKE